MQARGNNLFGGWLGKISYIIHVQNTIIHIKTILKNRLQASRYEEFSY